MSVEPEEGVAHSADGAPIGFIKLGVGPSLVFVHGSLTTGEQWLQVASALGEQFTCYLMDRRGRGRSGDAPDYSMRRECDDVAAVCRIAGPGAHLLGHSYGAICALEAVPQLSVGRLVVYEPPLPVGGPVAGEALDLYRAAVAEQRLDEALGIALREIVQMPEADVAGLRESPAWEGMAALTPTWTRELEVIDRLGPSVERYARLSLPVLLLRGTVAPEHLKVATDALAAAVPHARTVNFEGQGHFAHLTTPDAVASELARFLTSVS